jgi:S-adenosylmethionine:tRNA ribosyltransferase-isomerase
MQLSDFDYSLPEELIAQSWIEPRDHSRLLIVSKKDEKIIEKKFYKILDFLWENDVLVINKTRVINARLKGFMTMTLPADERRNWKKTKIKECEIFLHKQINSNSWDCMTYPWKKLKIGRKIFFEIDWKKVLQAEVKQNTSYWKIIEFSKSGLEFLEIIEKIWEIPLPPYIRKKLEDSERYQPIFSEVKWSVAAPTASLHFTKELFESLEKKWVKIEKVLLHVGLGTFNDVKTENILEHKMHWEYIELEEKVAERLNKYKLEWKNIIAVWTTSIRVLESFSDDSGKLTAWKTETEIFIYPGYKWKFVDAMITNFHLPESTLLMLVSSFAWKENIKKAYKHAVNTKYRFFSFGDAMFIK